jgi:hypothetical protein
MSQASSGPLPADECNRHICGVGSCARTARKPLLEPAAPARAPYAAATAGGDPVGEFFAALECVRRLTADQDQRAGHAPRVR